MSDQYFPLAQQLGMNLRPLLGAFELQLQQDMDRLIELHAENGGAIPPVNLFADVHEAMKNAIWHYSSASREDIWLKLQAECDLGAFHFAEARVLALLPTIELLHQFVDTLIEDLLRNKAVIERDIRNDGLDLANEHAAIKSDYLRLLPDSNRHQYARIPADKPQQLAVAALVERMQDATDRYQNLWQRMKLTYKMRLTTPADLMKEAAKRRSRARYGRLAASILTAGICVWGLWQATHSSDGQTGGLYAIAGGVIGFVATNMLANMISTFVTDFLNRLRR